MNNENEYKYLNLLPRPLDPMQLKACCRTENTIVAAGAGSGKTQVLATRFTWLVLSKNIPAKKILTLTFTKKAAAEMYNRIYMTLKFFAQNPDTPDKERKNAIAALEDFSEVHIQTLDSYCSSVVKQASNRYGINPDFTVDDNNSELNIKALQFVLKNKDSKAISFFSHNSNLQNFSITHFANIVTEYSSLADEKSFFSNNFSHQVDVLCSEYNKNISKLSSAASSLYSICKEAEPSELQDSYFIKLKNILSIQPEFPLTLSPDSVKTDLISEKLKEAFTFVSDLLKLSTLKRSNSFSLAKQTISELKPTLIAEIIFPLANILLYKEYFALLDEFTESINKEKRTGGNLTFADISKLSIKILTEQDDIRIQEQNAFDKIMIDEFQDDNKINKDLLFILSTTPDGSLHKEKLFFVGDEKQSIYKFRNADVSVFNQLKDDLQTKPLQMVYNYRSTNELLSSFNEIFGGIIPNEDSNQTQVPNQPQTQDTSEQDEPQEFFVPSIFKAETVNNFEAAFPAQTKAIKYDPKNKQELQPSTLTEKNTAGHVCIFNPEFIKDDTNNEFLSSNHDQEAYFIAKKIKEIYEKTPENERRYSDFAYLDKSRTNRHYITKWLNIFGIPYTVDQQSHIFAEAPVNDIYNFLRLCVFPSDLKAFASILTSPFTGLTIQSANTILCKISPLEKEESITAFNPEYSDLIKELLSKNEYEKYLSMQDYFNSNRKKFLSQKITTSLNTLWYDFGYRYHTLQNQTVKLLAEQYDMLFQLSCQADTNSKNLSWLVDQLATIRTKEKSVYNNPQDDIEVDLSSISYPLEQPDAVQILTIHKSKGLQYKHVFIKGCVSVPKGESSGLFYNTDDVGLTIHHHSTGNYFFEKNRDIEKLKNIAEFKRLIYVAVTRAEKDFYIIGSWPDKQKYDSDIAKLVCCFYPESLFSDADKTDVPVFTQNAPFDFTSIKPVTKKEAYSNQNRHSETNLEELKKLYENAQTVEYEWPESIKRRPSHLKDENNNFNSSNIESYENDSLTDADFNAADFGTLAHLYLETQANNIDIHTFKPAQQYFKNLTENQIKKNCELCIKYCEDFKNSEIGTAFEKCKQKKLFYKAEWDFKMFYEGHLFPGSIDLIFENDDKTYTIVDYKSDNVANVEKHKAQLECYKTAAAKLMNCSEDNIICYLFFMKGAQTFKL